MKATIQLSVPTKWQELTAKQVEFFALMLTRGHSEIEVMTRCFLKFAGLKLIKKDPVPDGSDLFYLFKKPGYRRFFLDVDRATGAIERMRFLVNEVSLFRLPERIKKYVPVDFRLYGVSLEEYILLDQYYIEYTKSKDVVWLDRMMAIVYRLYKETWNIDKHEKWTNRFKRIPLARKYVIYLWYTGLKAWFMHKYWFIYNQPEVHDDTPADEIIMGLISALNEGNVTLNDKVKATPIHEVLYELNKKIERATNV
jgi:hypothetical protein